MHAANLIQFNKWLQEETQIHKRLLSSGPTISKLDTPSSKSGKRFDFKKQSKLGESALSSNTDKNKIDSKCPLCDTPIIKIGIARSSRRRKRKIDTTWQSKRHCALLVCPIIAQQMIVQEKKCGIDSFEKTDNRLLHYRKKSDVSSVSMKSESTNLTSN